MSEGMPERRESASEQVDTSFVEMAEGGFLPADPAPAEALESLEPTAEEIPVAEPPTAEVAPVEVPANPEVLNEEIETQEARLSQNTTAVHSAVERAQASERTPEKDGLKWQLQHQKIKNAYDKAKRTIDNWSVAASLVPITLLVGSFGSGIKGDMINTENFNNMGLAAGGEQWHSLATNMFGGAGIAAAGVMGAWALARGINHLKSRAAEKENDRANYAI